MDDCESWGRKHKLKISSVEDHFLVGNIWYVCEHCTTVVKVDRFWFYVALTHQGGFRGP